MAFSRRALVGCLVIGSAAACGSCGSDESSDAASAGGPDAGQAPPGLALGGCPIDLVVGDPPKTITAPDGATFRSEDETVATASPSGAITPAGRGETTITVVRGDARASCGVKVHAKPESVDGCTNADPDDIRRFPECPTGGGIFGRWVTDEDGLPAFDVELDQTVDARAEWKLSEPGRSRRDHFVVSGNERSNFLASDDGYVQLFSNERAPQWLNRFDEAKQNLGGGFSYVRDGALAYATAFRYAPGKATSRRRFGVGYASYAHEHAGLRVRHDVVAPFGDDPVLVDEVEVTNTSASPKSIQHFEYWDVARHVLSLDWVRTGVAAAPSDGKREGFNGRFLQDVTYDAGAKVLLATTTPKPGETVPPQAAPAADDMHPARVFLAAVDAEVDAVWGDQRAFFDGGTASAPGAVATNKPQGALLSSADGDGQPATFVMRTPLALAPGESKKLRFVYGYLPAGYDTTLLARYKGSAGVRAASAARWKDRLAYAWAPGMPLLHRETTWRSHLFYAHGVRNDAFGTRYTAQGSAYLYLHGADGAARDQALFSLAATHLDPALGRGNLTQVMSLTDATTGKTSYAFANVGQVDGATLHDLCSDLDLYLMLGVAEYLALTGDSAFLDAHVPFYPRGAGHPADVKDDTVLDHLRVALRHLRDDVGKGSHGLLRIQQGDWSDGIVYEDLSPTAVSFTTQNGESIPNSQIALVALPLLANQLRARDAGLATQLDALAQSLIAPVRATYATRWFGRAWVRNSLNQAYLKGNDLVSDPFNASFIDLEAQPWGILSGVLDGAARDRLVDEVAARLDTPSPIGPTLREQGQVWPAISFLMTWAYARHRPELAWRSVERQLYAAHAKRWPELWHQIWSGPDGVSAVDGSTWASPVTPMTDFPVANANPDAMFLFGLLRTAGLEPHPSGDGLVVAPHRAPGKDEYVVETPLVRVDVRPRALRVEYRAKTTGSLAFHLAVPPEARVEVDGAPVTPTAEPGSLRLATSFAAGDTRRIAARW